MESNSSLEEQVNNVVHLVMSFSSAYCEYAVVAVWSVMENLSLNTVIKLSILHSDIQKNQMVEFIAFFERWPNIHIDFINVQIYADKYNLPINFIKDKATCYPLLSAEIFSEESKILVLDSDIIVKKDIYSLWKTDIKDELIAAVLDVDFNGQLMSNNRKYIKYYDKIRLKNSNHYIQAG
ncbi:MAG: hypothetical protein K6D97_06365, partial [Clostridia bacterium]|nr:hypothetical protein [Clostridia bacterium]